MIALLKLVLHALDALQLSLLRHDEGPDILPRPSRCCCMGSRGPGGGTSRPLLD